MFVVIGLFVALLFLNIYFRVKVIKVYKILIKNRVEFSSKHIFSKEKMEEEIIPKYPKLENEIRSFANNITFSIKIAALLILLISVAGAIINLA